MTRNSEVTSSQMSTSKKQKKLKRPSKMKDVNSPLKALQFQMMKNSQFQMSQGGSRTNEYSNPAGFQESDEQLSFAKYRYHDPQLHYEVPVPKLPHIQQFFPNIQRPKRLPILNEI